MKRVLFCLCLLATTVTVGHKVNFVEEKHRTYYRRAEDVAKYDTAPQVAALRLPTLSPEEVARVKAKQGTNVSRNMLQMSFMHRHGARTEPIVSDKTLNWAYCILSEVGGEMAISLGKFLRQRYGDFIPLELNRERVESRSTDFERTILTGVGVLRGLFPNTTVDIPYISHEADNVDWDLGYYYSWPTADLRKSYFSGYDVRQDNATLQIMTQAELDTIGRVLNVPELCANQPTTCALLGEDIATCRRSNGGLEPELGALLPKLFLVQEQSLDFLYLYKPEDRYWKNAGPYGIRITTKIVAQFQEVMRWYALPADEQKAFKRPPQVYHYSAHDVTVYGLLSALSVINETTTGETMLVPTFTATVLLDLYDDGTVEIAYARCDQEYDSGYAYHIVPQELVHLECITASGQVYRAAACPLDDLVRFVNKRNGVSPQVVPPCYADPSDVTTSSCAPGLGVNATLVAELQADTDYANSAVGKAHISALENCLQYRRRCPEYACNDAHVVADAATEATLSRPAGGYLYNETDNSCVPRVTTKKPAPPVAIVGRVVVCIACAILGVLLGVFVEMCRDQWKRTHPSSTPQDTTDAQTPTSDFRRAEE